MPVGTTYVSILKQCVFLCISFLSFGYMFAYPGCTNASACNYDAGATTDDGTCVICDTGADQICDGVSACCFDTDNSGVCDYDEICNYPVAHGCTNPSACNYDPNATVDVGGCIVCGVGNTCNYAINNTSCCLDPDDNTICGDQGGSGNGSPTTPTNTPGCMVSTACNYNPSATTNDGSCVFPKCVTSGYDGRCQGDQELEPFMDNCGVCDADVSNDNACENITPIDDDPVDDDPVDDDPVDDDPVDDDPVDDDPVDDDPVDDDPVDDDPIDDDPIDDDPVDDDPVDDDPVDDPIDCYGVVGGTNVPGTSCDDTNPLTINDTWNLSCRCAGIQPGETDCAGEIDGSALPGTSCDDTNEMTIDDVWDDTCTCNGTEIDEEIVPEEPAFPIVEGSVYVEFTNPVEQEAFKDLIKKYTIDSIDQPFSNLDLDIYRIDFDPNIPYGDFVRALQERFGNNITFTEPIPLIQVNLPLVKAGQMMEQTIPDYLTQIGYDTLLEECSYLFTTQQRKIRVAIIDNGYAEHDDIRDNVVYTYDAADKDKDVTIRETSEACAHGNIDAGLVGAISTNDIGIISAGYNPELVLIKATPDGRPCTDITAGIEGLAKAADEADIINVSWGVDFDSQVLEKVINKILNKGVIIVAAAGNLNTNKLFYPAAYPGVISVGAVDENNKKAHFSNYGNWVDLSAPGVDMLSTALENGYAKVSGTSQASPLTAGWLAFLMSHNLGVEELYRYLTPIDRADMGQGIINPAAYCADDVLHVCTTEEDCEEHGIAPVLQATTTSAETNKMYGLLLILLVLLVGGGIALWQKDWFMNH